MTDWINTAREADYFVHGFKFADGSELDLRLHYRTLGSLAPDRSNAVLMLHGTTGGGKQFLQPDTADFLFAKGQPLDSSKYFIIFPDDIGHGGSSKPSDGLEANFPRYCYADIVDAQHRLVTEGLGLERLRLVLGTSMGGMQTWMWGERYPEMMDALLPIASLPERVDGRNLLWRRLLIKIVQLGSTAQPPSLDPTSLDLTSLDLTSLDLTGLGLAWNLFELMVGSPARLTTAFAGPADADSHIESVAEEALKVQKVNDVIWEFDASRDYNPSSGLHLIQAPLLAVNFADDELNPVELGGLERGIAQVKYGRAVTLPVGPKSRGHQTLRIAEVWQDHVRQLLQQTEARAPKQSPAAMHG
jgi:homoserine O-acetyltransferase/O-succinyltransferase